MKEWIMFGMTAMTGARTLFPRRGVASQAGYWVVLAAAGLAGSAGAAFAGSSPFAGSAALAAASVQIVQTAQRGQADSLYQAARAQMLRSEYAQAARTFEQVIRRFPNSEYAPDAYYYRAFSLYRTGDAHQLRPALQALEEQRERFPEAASRGDSPTLRMRIVGELAREGDADAALAVATAASFEPFRAWPDTVLLGRLQRAERVVEELLASSPRGNDFTFELEYPRVGRIATPVQGLPALPARNAPTASQTAASQTAATAVRGSVVQTQGSQAQRLVEIQALPGLPVASITRQGQDCDRPTQDVRMAALQAMARMDPAAAAPMLRQALELRDPCSVPLRVQAVTLLAARPTPETVDVLLEVAAEDPHEDVRAAAVERLASSRDPRAIDAVGEIITRSSDDAVRQRALRALASSRSDRAGEMLRELATRRDLGSVRATAITQLTRNPTPENLALLREIYPSLADTRLKEQILSASAGPILGRTYYVGVPSSTPLSLGLDRLREIGAAGQGQIETERARLEAESLRRGVQSYTLTIGPQVGGAPDEQHVAWLLGVARDPNEPIALRARAANTAGPHAPVQALVQLYDNVPDTEMRSTLIAVLGRRSEPEALDKLIAVALSEDAPELRRAAILWLGQSREPRAAEALLRVLRR